MPRSLKRLGLVLGLSGLLALLFVAALLGRLAMGPLSAGPLTPWIAARADAALPGLSLEVDDAALAWHPGSGRAEIRLGNIRLETSGGDSFAMPRLVVICAAWPLLLGELRPHSLTLEDAEASIDWSAARLLEAVETATGPPHGNGAKTPAVATPRLPQELRGALDRLGSTHMEAGVSTGRLERISVSFREIRLIEGRSGTIWRLPDARVSLARDAEGWRLSASGKLTAADNAKAVELAVAAKWEPAADTAGSLTLDLDELHLPPLAEGIPELVRLQGLDMPARATLDAHLDATGRLTAAALEMTAEAGELAWPGLYPEPRAFSGLRAGLRWMPEARRLEIKEVAVDFAPTTLALSGEMAFAPGTATPHLTLRGGWDAMSTSALVRYWPAGMAASGRDWIAQNIPEGQVREAELHVELGPEDWKTSPLPASAFHLDFRFAGLEAHVLRPAPPLLGAGGTARLTAETLTMQLEAGELDGLPVTGSTVTLSDLDDPELQWGDVRLRLSGDLPQVLRLVDHEPMGYVSAFGMSPDDVKGHADLEADLRFPLLNDLPLEEVGIDIEADISGFAIPDLREPGGFSDGRLSISVDGDSLTARGRGRLSGVPLQLVWREAFSPPAGTPSSRYDVAAVLSEDDLETLAIDPGPYFAGRMVARMSLFGNGPELIRGRLDADLTPAELDLDLLGWKKPLGKTASLSFEMDFGAGEAMPVENVAFESGEDRFEGMVTVDRATGDLRRAELDRLILGRTAVAGEILRGPDGGLTIDIAGPSLDLAPLLAEMELPNAEPGAPPAPPLDIRIAAEQGFGLDEVEFRNLNLGLSREGGFWRRISAHAGLGDDSGLSFDLGASRQEELRAVSAHADDAGKVLRGLGLFRLLEGGILDVDGHIEGYGGEAKVSGRARMVDFKLVQTPTMAAELVKEETSRLDEFVGEDGLVFDELVLPFTVGGGIIDLDDGRANGPDIGLTLEGQLDQGFERLNVNGIIVPAYRLNSLLGKIPIIGRIFTGGSGGGLFALSYRVEGEMDDPEVSIDPLTAILPGILRKPFEGSKGAVDSQKEREPDDQGGG